MNYDARGDKLGVAVGDLNERIAEKLEELETGNIDVEQELKRDYHIITAGKRLDQVGRDFVRHYSTAWETGKAMLVCIDKITCVRMHKLVEFYWNERIGELEAQLPQTTDEQYRRRHIEWMRQTQMAVVVSEEQGEVEKFRKWELDITPHRRLIKEGIELPEAMRKQPQFQNMQRLSLDDAFKAEEHPFRVAIVCAMWLTGFDVPSLSTLYLDKPLKAHTLMQAIARANRGNEGKNNGMIVDYCGILKNLRNSLARQGIHPGRGPSDDSGLSLERANRASGNLFRGGRAGQDRGGFRACVPGVPNGAVTLLRQHSVVESSEGQGPLYCADQGRGNDRPGLTPPGKSRRVPLTTDLTTCHQLSSRYTPMFGIGLPEMIVIFAVALIVVGPDKLPGLARSVAKGVMEMKKTLNQLKDSLTEEQSTLDSVHKELRTTAEEFDTDPSQWHPAPSPAEKKALGEAIIELESRPIQPGAPTADATNAQSRQDTGIPGDASGPSSTVSANNPKNENTATP